MSPLLQFGVMVGGLYLAGWLSHKAGLSTVVGYILLGVALGPGGPLPLLEPSPITDLFGELGLLLLLFFMGLEFSFGRFLDGGRNAMAAGTVDLLHLLAGTGLGFLLGFGLLPSLFLGSAIYISSSGVIAKLLADEDLSGYPEAERTLGVLVFEDLAMVVVLAGLGLATAGGSPLQLLGVGAFLAAYGIFLRYGRGLLERLFSREGETLVLLLLTVVLAFALAAARLGFPEAVAAFLLGMVVAESRHRDRVEERLTPWHQVAAAAFFLDVGLHVELGTALGQLPNALLLLTATVALQLATGVLGGRVSGLSRRASIGHGLMLLPRGEFSLVIVGLAASAPQIAPEVREALQAMVSMYVVLSVLLGSVVFRRYDTINGWLVAALRTPEQRRREARRQAELEGVRLD